MNHFKKIKKNLVLVLIKVEIISESQKENSAFRKKGMILYLKIKI
jgi:hypothetical protein